jgi:hypothetical protein
VPDFRLPTPTAKVRLSDGRILEARIVNSDYLRWDRTAAKHGWPTGTAAPFLWMTFLAWSALRREGQIAEGVTWEEFSDRLAEQVELEQGEAEGSQNGIAAVDPTHEPVAPE